MRYATVTDITLTQAEADALMAMEKHRADTAVWDYPSLGGRITTPLVSVDGRVKFFLDIWRSGLKLGKGTLQNRGRKVIVLARLDCGGPPHRNPDGEEVDCPHLHLYRENFGDKWAFPVPAGSFSNPGDPWVVSRSWWKFENGVISG